MVRFCIIIIFKSFQTFNLEDRTYPYKAGVGDKLGTSWDKEGQAGNRRYPKLRQKGLFGQFSVKFNFDMIFKQNCVKQKIHLGENYTDPPPLFKNSPYAHEITPSISQNSITLFTPVDNLQQVVRLYTSM